MDVPASTLLVMIFAVLAVVVFVIRAILRLGKGSADKTSGKTGSPKKLTKEEKIEKDQALENFKKIHSAARDNRKKIAKEIESDPQKATQALRSMMKR